MTSLRIADLTYVNNDNADLRESDGLVGGRELAGLFDTTVRDRLTLDTAKFIESQLFFFVATANAKGDCDCSYKGREQLSEGGFEPLLRVLDAKTLVLPDYKGNNMFNTMGNLIANAGIGLLFVDFVARARFRVNGQARIIDDATSWAGTWPRAQRYIEVAIDQAYGNCNEKITQLVSANPQVDSNEVSPSASP